MFVGEVFLSSFFEVVLDKLVATPLLEYARRQKVESTLEDWRKTLLHLQAVVNDAEQKQIKDTAVKMWLDDLKALAYDIEDVLDEFDSEARRRSLVEGSGQTSTSKVRKLIPNFHFSGVRFNDKIDESEVYGRDADKEKIMELLLSDEVHDAGRKVTVIPIVGMGGVGKTTLAQIIYNDKRVEDNFDIRVWMCVSVEFDLVGITRAILESDPIRWSSLEKTLRAGARGSVVMVTTRHEDVASIMRTTLSHHLSELSDEHCWSVFADLAFENITPDARQNLEPIGRQIFKKCKGLPLAAKTLGGLLRSKHDENAWKNMLNSEIWDLPAEQSSILPALHLSYHYLPTTLKQCFAYCSIFPKDHEFQKEQLILLWVAQGLVGGLKRGEIMEEAGSWKAKQYFKEGMPRDVSTCYLADKVLHDLLPTLRSLRVLSLSHYNITHLPDSFGNLKHLRYLNLSYTAIKELPKSIGALLNLQSLMLSNCGSLTELPSEIGELINLRHFDISETNIEGMPIGINRLKDLRRLSTFVVVKDGGARICELRDLSCLGGALSILNLQNVVHATDALEANLKDKKDLEDLVFSWDPNAIVGDSDNQTRVLEWLQPHNKLKRLTIEYYCGVKFPNWLGDSSFMNLVSLEIKNCKNCLSLPPLGQLKSLKDLCIVKMDGVQKVGTEFYRNGSGSSFKPFVSLVTLVFREMLEWEEWVCSEVEFPCLKELHIVQCPKLKGDVPKHLPHLTELEITECGQLMDSPPMLPSIDQLRLDKFDDAIFRNAVNLSSLTCLNASNICRIPVELQHLHSLVELYLVDCQDLIELPTILHKLISLKRLVIKKCPNLSSVSEMELPSMLEYLKIKKCRSLESLPDGMMQNNNCLRRLIVKGCGSLTSFPNVASLEYLEIKNCGKVELLLPQDIMMHNCYPSLRGFVIKSSCDSLRLFPLGFFTKLEHLLFRRFANLEALYIPDGLHHVDLTSLQCISIWDCPNLVSFPQGGLPTPNLRMLLIGNCKKLKSLPQQMHTLITSLQDLTIVDCPEIDSFPQGVCQLSFPEKWLLPSTLSFVGIYGFPNLKSLDNMGLHDLKSLETLKIQGCTMLKSFPKQGCRPPYHVLKLRTALC
ncbi:hypothetical protein AAG906_012181 [Vitis piasezkii]